MKETRAEHISVDKLRPFDGHPFKVVDNEEMDQLVWSILTQGLLTPLVVRPLDNGEYEVISGHRRLHACKKAGIEMVPALIYSIDRDAAAIALVDSNLHRERILPSEKAFAYKLKLDALKHQGQTCGQIALSPGVELSYLDADTQRQVLEAMELEYCTPSFSQTVRMKNLYREGNLTAEKISNIMAEEKANQRETVRIPKERLKPVLPSGLDAQKTEEFIVKACDHYKRYLQRQRSQER